MRRAALLVTTVALLAVHGTSGVELPGLEVGLGTLEKKIEAATDSVWSKEVGGKFLVGLGAGTVTTVVLPQVRDVLNSLAMAMTALGFISLFVNHAPEHIGASSFRNDLNEIHNRAAKLFDQDGDERLTLSDPMVFLRRILPFIKRQSAFIFGVCVGIGLFSRA
mmetsp:Transcript_12114/g.41167  ORF Transcript_12114/g.41167 Transcript_12114/m.41167 type:complete len:164 (-) Transcript_12114:470-961(-)